MSAISLNSREQNPGTNMRILVVEDDRTAASFIAKALTEADTSLIAPKMAKMRWNWSRIPMM